MINKISIKLTTSTYARTVSIDFSAVILSSTGEKGWKKYVSIKLPSKLFLRCSTGDFNCYKTERYRYKVEAICKKRYVGTIEYSSLPQIRVHLFSPFLIHPGSSLSCIYVCSFLRRAIPPIAALFSLDSYNNSKK